MLLTQEHSERSSVEQSCFNFVHGIRPNATHRNPSLVQTCSFPAVFCGVRVGPHRARRRLHEAARARHRSGRGRELRAARQARPAAGVPAAPVPPAVVHVRLDQGEPVGLDPKRLPRTPCLPQSSWVTRTFVPHCVPRIFWRRVWNSLEPQQDNHSARNLRQKQSFHRFSGVQVKNKPSFLFSVQCSKSCETGFRTREIKCMDEAQRPSTQCPLEEKPETRQTCNAMPCPTTLPGR